MAASVRAWKKTYPNLKESTVCEFKKRNEAKLKNTSRKDVSPNKKLANNMRGQPNFTWSKTQHKGGVVDMQTALGTTKALVKRYPLLEKENLIIRASWGKSLFHRVGFVLRSKDYNKSANSRKSAKKIRIEISLPNCQLHGEVPDTTIANYQFRSDPFELHPDFFKYNRKG